MQNSGAVNARDCVAHDITQSSRYEHELHLFIQLISDEVYSSRESLIATQQVYKANRGLINKDNNMQMMIQHFHLTLQTASLQPGLPYLQLDLLR